MQLTHNIDQIPDVVSVTDLRYKTNMLLKKLKEENRPVIVVKKSKKIAVIYPISNIGEQCLKYALKIKPYKLGGPKTIDRSMIYNNYLKEKVK